ncbi:MAG: DEAD/DEAH box helicase family protein [Proteobacteria bacterium]|nr:DEAD/DEAH box helicase family protein [Pseudomonadota bacterium]
MNGTNGNSSLKLYDRVRVPSRPELGTGEVLRIAEFAGVYQADVAFDSPEGRKLETIPLELLESTADLWQRLAAGNLDDPEFYRLKQIAFEFIYSNNGGELSSSRVNLLPHQILLVHDLVAMRDRRLLIADEVGLGKTIETGMLFRELIARGEAERILIVTPAGLTRNWRQELANGFRLHFEILNQDFLDHGSATWETHHLVIASIDTLKVTRRVQRLLSAPPWDLIVIDEAHHLSRIRTGNKTNVTLNYKLAEALRGHTRDFLFLTATPHQGNAFQFWSLIQLLNDQLFASSDDVSNHRGLLARVMIRRTKREVTDVQGNSIFCRRQVFTEAFSMAPRERNFYEKLSDYLREGYDAAGIHQAKTTSKQRAIGFVMATFQKIMSSSPRAILQALRRRLLVLLTRKQIQLEAKRRAGATVAEEIMGIQDEMLNLATKILGLEKKMNSDAEAYVQRVRRRILKKMEEDYETTTWSLDPDEEAEDGVFAEADIPNEIEKVRELISLVPDGRDRRFDTLVRAISDLSRSEAKERFVIFTQYLDTLEFLKEELGKIFGLGRIATIKGGPIEDKIAAVEAFWKKDGAHFLISTSAGGEGINLQIGRILFNYDLPWNPMAVEQRIGRVHRYGQKDTVQVYNLVAEDTVEERIYDLLEGKLLEIAGSIGKIDEEGRPMEDFRTDILGYLGSRPDYQDLYKMALVDKDYRRTEKEMQKMFEEALRAREALNTLSQDLSSFNLEHFKKLEGRYTLGELGQWVRNAILKLGGAAIPDGDFWLLITPDSMRQSYRLAPRYERVTFDRELALRVRNCELAGLGHPLVDALIEEFRQPVLPGNVSGAASGNKICAHYLVQHRTPAGQLQGRTFNFQYNAQTSEVLSLRRFELYAAEKSEADLGDFQKAQEGIEAALQNAIIEWLPDRQSRAGLQISLLGLCRFSA